MQHRAQPQRNSYGWLMVVMAAAGMVGTLPGRTHGLGMITERLLVDPHLALDRLTFGRMNFWATLIGATFCLGTGWLIDRYGARRVMTSVVLLLGATVLVMGKVTQPHLFFVLLTLTRGLGQSALSVVALTLIGKWFGQRQSMAMGVFSVLVAMGFMTAFGVCEGWHEAPWRTVWSSLGWLLAAGLTPATWLLVRDGHMQPFDAAAPAEPLNKAYQADVPFAAALQTPAFWVFGLATAVYALIAAGTSLFNESLLAERGFPKDAFYQVMIAGALIGLPANFLAGWLARGRSLRAVTCLALLILAASLAALPQVATPAQLWAYALGMGVSGGIVTVIFFTVWAQFYGRRDLGRIQGAAQMLTVLASAAGPEIFAEWHHRTGSYAGLLYVLASAVLSLAVLTAITALPQPESAGDGDDDMLPQTVATGD